MPKTNKDKKTTAMFKKVTSRKSDTEKSGGVTTAYRPTKAVTDRRQKAYSGLEGCIKERDKTWKQFNGPEGDRTAVQYWDDSDKRLNSYTPTRDEQGKEDWQSNAFNPITRNKLKAIVAGVALQVPKQEFKAFNKEGLYSARRAEFIKQMVNHSRNIGNVEMDIFFEAWGTAGRGTMVKYDGYLKTKEKKKFIKSFDYTTGEVEFDEREVIVEDRPIDVEVPLSELFIPDFTVFDIQDQEEIFWVKKYNFSNLKKEFGHYPNFKYVKSKSGVAKFNTTIDTYFYEKWSSRVADEDDYEVIRKYNKNEDVYEIWCNGVDLLSAPMLWGRGKKMYPFSKTIFEPFIDKQFFYGASLPGLLQGNQDIDNNVWNSVVDKLYRSLKPPMLVGLANKDLMDLESELVDQDNKIYVPDIQQVKPFPYEGVSNSDIAMLNIVAKFMDNQSVDSTQSGIQGKGVTAREIIMADEYAKKIKGIFFMFLSDLWLQKTKIRVENVLLNYMQTKKEAIIGRDGAKIFQDITTIYNVNNVEHSDGTRGTLGIQIVPTNDKLPSVSDIQMKEEVMQKEGINYKLIAVTEDYLDNWEFDFSITTDSVFNSDKIRMSAELDEKHGIIAKFFPEHFVANKDKLFAETVAVYGESAQDYKQPAPPAPPSPETGANPLDMGAQALKQPAGAGMM